MLTKRRLWKLLLLAALLGLAGLAGYYSVEVLRARAYTREVILPRAREAKWPLRFADLSPRQRAILLMVEDPAFFRHGGVDLTTPGAGITTITQGLAKLLYFERFTPGLAKLRQTLLAVWALDPLVTKEEQLELFINLVPLGRDLRGLVQGAEAYFHKSFAELSEEEYISLVAAIIAPAVFNPGDHPALNAERARRIKLLAEGRYQPKGLCDLYYGPLDPAVQAQLPAFSYFASYYR